jgi:dienelactone hydrolase
MKWLVLFFGLATSTMAAEPAQLLETPDGLRFFIAGQKGDKPAPTLFIFGLSARSALHDDDYFKSGSLLIPQGWLCASVDVPCHDEDTRPGEPSALKGWRYRLDKNENFVAPFVQKCQAALDHLVKEGYADPQRVAVAGISRGGFCAFHFAAAEPRVRAVVGFAPVTDLLVLEEFHGLENHAITKSLAAVNLADKLVGKHVWMCIGNNDERVGTEPCFAFARKVAQANLAAGKPATIELHVMPSGGHTIHATAHDEAAAWLAAKVK